MWLPEITANGVLAFATLVYGAATTALVISSHRGRQQRHEHFHQEQKDQKLETLYSAFCDAWGYFHGVWEGGNVPVTATEASKITEALIRLEVQLRLNNHVSLADDFQRAIMTRDGRRSSYQESEKRWGCWANRTLDEKERRRKLQTPLRSAFQL
jgi:hypothetical protein